MAIPNPNRPPVITIMGHVDHGKTSLLDQIRKTHVVDTEAGGITQKVSAYQVDYQEHSLTFIDTPGHAAFSAMRARGGKVADLAVLVVAADDGVMPQTKESLEHIKQSEIPYIVAINKIDLDGANPQKVKTQFAEMGEYLEGFGGNVPVVEVSAKTGQNLASLLETIILLADLLELKDNSNEPTNSLVLESEIHPQIGPTALLLVKSGKLCLKDPLFNGSRLYGRVRAMFDFTNHPLTLATASTPVRIIGFETIPNVGDVLFTLRQEETITQSIITPISVLDESNPPIPIIIKADLAGSLEAIVASLPPNIHLVSSSVGLVNENDVEMAKQEKALIVGFNAKLTSSVKKLIQIESVTFNNFRIIYELLDYLKEQLALHQKEEVKPPLGTAKILKIFHISGQTIYGCQVLSGKLCLGDTIGSAKISSLRTQKNQITEAKKGNECGLVLLPPLDLKEGDIVESYSNKL